MWFFCQSSSVELVYNSVWLSFTVAWVNLPQRRSRAELDETRFSANTALYPTTDIQLNGSGLVRMHLDTATGSGSEVGRDPDWESRTGRRARRLRLTTRTVSPAV